MQNKTTRADSAAPKACILVPSCDGYRDLWPVFLAFFRRAWPDCPYPIYLGSNMLSCSEHPAQPLAIGKDEGWSISTRRMLEKLDYEYVLVLLEDFLLLSPVDSTLLARHLVTLHELGGAYLRLRPFPPPDYHLARYPLVGENAIGAPYRASLQAAFWRKSALLEMLVDGESAWQFEIFGARRSDMRADGFYSTWAHALDFYAAVTMGKWIPYGVALCREHGIVADLTARPMMTPREAARRAMRRFVNEAWDAVPWRQRAVFLRWFRATALRKPTPAP
jgi:hypothetical protein